MVQGVYQVPGDKNNPYAFEIKTPVAVHRLAAQSQVPFIDETTWLLCGCCRNLHGIDELWYYLAW